MCSKCIHLNMAHMAAASGCRPPAIIVALDLILMVALGPATVTVVEAEGIMVEAEAEEGGEEREEEGESNRV